MSNQNTPAKLHLANVIEENEQGFHRETLWYGGDPENLALLIIDVMKDWYEPNKDKLDPSIIRYHKMLENRDNISFEQLEGEGFNADGMSITVQLTNDINVMFGFVIGEICNIFGQSGETPENFKSLAEFRSHFINTYEIEEDLKKVLEAVNEATISKALFLIDMKYGYTERHFKSCEG